MYEERKEVNRIMEAAEANVPWIPLTSVEEMAQTDYDVLIIGSGAGGGSVLWRLCEQWQGSGRRIGMIEAGNAQLPTHAFNIATFNEQRAAAFWMRIAEWSGRAWPDFAGAKMVKALGGRTLLWYNFTPRFAPEAFRTWPITYRDILPYYQLAERIMHVNPFYSQGSALQEILLERLNFGGFPQAAGLPISADLEVTQFGQVHSSVFFSSIIFLALALNLRKFDLAINARAVQILTEQGRAVGVKVMTPDLKSYCLKAKTIVVSASTWETPRLLLYSNIPGEAIGRYLVNHSQVSADGAAAREQFPEVLGTATLAVPGAADRPYSLVAYSDFLFSYIERPLREEITLALRGYGVVEPQWSNYVSLDPLKRDAYGVPLLNVHFSYNDKDYEVIRRAYADLLNFSAAMKLTMVKPPQLEPPGIDNHEGGTCRMGDDPHTSVTDRYGQVHGVPGLYIADNSVVNLSSPSNITLTTIALAIRTADYIAERMKQPDRS